MDTRFNEGDFLIFQVESGFGLLRVLMIETRAGSAVWHVQVYSDMFLDVEMAESAIDHHEKLTVEIPHVALTERAFESTQVAFLKNIPLDENEKTAIPTETEISDRSIRLHLGLR